MLDGSEQPDKKLNSDEAFDLLQELERNTSDDLRQQRAHFRLAVKANVILQPGNAGELLKFKIKGVTGDVSASGCSALFPVPVHVGNIYRLTFDRGTLDLPLTFARCVRCRLVREDAFEAGFAFFRNVCLPQRAGAGAGAEAVVG